MTYSDLELKLRGEIERDFTIGPRYPGVLESWSSHPHRGIAATGEPFVEIHGMGKGSEQKCFDAALAAFRKYAAGKAGALYWRTYPEIEGGKFYMRLLISDKQPLAIQQEMK
jgi:hypothetical protein